MHLCTLCIVEANCCSVTGIVHAGQSLPMEDGRHKYLAASYVRKLCGHYCFAGLIPRTPQHVPVADAEPASPVSDAQSHGSEDEEASVASWADLNLPDVDHATRQVILNSIRAGAASDEDEEDEELLQLLSEPSQTDSQPAKGYHDDSMRPSSDKTEHSEVETELGSSSISNLSSQASDAATSVPQTSVRLRDGSSEDDAAQAVLPSANQPFNSDVAPSASHVSASSDPDSPAELREYTQTRGSRPAAHNQLDGDDRDEYRQWDQDYWEQKDPQAVDNTVAAAQIWSRIIRMPRKRGKHIIVDVCSAQQNEGATSGVNTSEGHLVRQIIATTDKRTWLGAGGYRLVRKSRWGDLWPKYYQDYALTQKPA